MPWCIPLKALPLFPLECLDILLLRIISIQLIIVGVTMTTSTALVAKCLLLLALVLIISSALVPELNELANIHARLPSFDASAHLVHPHKALSESSAHASKMLLEEHHQRVKNSQSLSCGSLPADYSPMYTCSGVVTYSFVIADGQTVDTMETMVRQVASYLPGFLSTPCKGAIKRQLCAAVYLPCEPSTLGVPNMVVPLPYTQPCDDLCTTVADTCGAVTLQTLGLDALGVGSSCSDITKYYPDSSLQTGQCNRLSAAGPLLAYYGTVATPSEHYLGQLPASLPAAADHTPMCADVVSEVYTALPSEITGLAPLLPPFVYQMYQETQVTALQTYIPKYFPQSCLSAQRSLFCAVNFLAPESMTSPEALYLGAAVFNNAQEVLYLPSFPHRDTCAVYHAQCPLLVSVGGAALDIDCDQQFNVGYTSLHMFPNDTQTLASIPLTAAITVNLQTHPHRSALLENLAALSSSSPEQYDAEASAAQSQYDAVQCPYGYAVWDAVNDIPAAGMYVDGTGCGLQCPSPIYTPPEYTFVSERYFYTLLVSLVLTLLQVINISVLKPQRRNLFFCASVVSSFCLLIAQTLQFLHVHARHPGDYYMTSTEVQCASDTQWYSLHRDDTLESADGQWCVATSLISLVLNAFSQWILFGCSMEIWLRCVHAVRQIEPYRRYYLHGTLVLCALYCTYLLTRVTAWDGDAVVVGGVQVNCLSSLDAEDNRDVQLYSVTIPQMVNFVASFVLITHSLYACLRTTLRARGPDNMKKTMHKLWKSYGMLWMFLLLQISLFPILIFYYNLYEGYVMSEQYVESSVQWVSCLFAQFTDRSSDASVLQTCGVVPAHRPSPAAFITPLSVEMLATALVLFWITFNNKEVKDFWARLGMRCLHSLGLEGLCVCASAVSEDKKQTSQSSQHMSTTLTSSALHRLNQLSANMFSPRRSTNTVDNNNKTGSASKYLHALSPRRMMMAGRDSDSDSSHSTHSISFHNGNTNNNSNNRRNSDASRTTGTSVTASLAALPSAWENLGLFVRLLLGMDVSASASAALSPAAAMQRRKTNSVVPSCALDADKQQLQLQQQQQLSVSVELPALQKPCAGAGVYSTAPPSLMSTQRDEDCGDGGDSTARSQQQPNSNMMMHVMHVSASGRESSSSASDDTASVCVDHSPTSQQPPQQQQVDEQQSWWTRTRSTLAALLTVRTDVASILAVSPTSASSAPRVRRESLASNTSTGTGSGEHAALGSPHRDSYHLNWQRIKQTAASFSAPVSASFSAPVTRASRMITIGQLPVMDLVREVDTDAEAAVASPEASRRSSVSRREEEESRALGPMIIRLKPLSLPTSPKRALEVEELV